MTEKDRNSSKRVADLNEIKPELDDDWFAEADAFIGTKLVRRGRPRSANPKKPVSLRLDSDVIDWFKRGGDGWQTRINEELRKLAGL